MGAPTGIWSGRCMQRAQLKLPFACASDSTISPTNEPFLGFLGQVARHAGALFSVLGGAGHLCPTHLLLRLGCHSDDLMGAILAIQS